MALTVQITNEQQIPLQFTPDEPLDGPIELVVESGDGTFNRLSDTSFMLISPDTEGVQVTTYTASADADRGDGVVTLMETIVMTTDDPMATTLGGTFGAPEPK